MEATDVTYSPKAKSLLKGPADVRVISFPKPKANTSEFKKLLHKLRSKAHKAPTMEEITNEVEVLRIKRYGKK